MEERARRHSGSPGPLEAQAFWLREPGCGEIRTVRLPPPGPADVLVRTIRSAISRGTESLVFSGRVPPSQWEAMRAPFQEGGFPGPVKYGYLSVGVVELGPPDLVGRTVFCLYPHQTAYVVQAAAVTVVPWEVPADRAVLTGLVETAVNAVWDAGPLLGDRVAVVGAGALGCCVARLLVRIPGVSVTLVDVDPARAGVAATLGVGFARPDDAPRGLDLVVHASATSAGLQCSLELLAPEGTVVELSWFGDEETTLALGGAFHSKRLTVRASQVGSVALPRRGRRTTAERLELALDLLRDPLFDALLTGHSPFAELPVVLPRLVSGQLPALCHSVTYNGVAGRGPGLDRDLDRGLDRDRDRDREGCPVFSVTVRDHMLVAHSLRGVVFGRAQALHGATYVVDATFRGESLDDEGILVDIAWAADELHRLLATLTHRNLDGVPELVGRNTTTEVLAQHVSDRLVDRISEGPVADRVSSLEVTLHESPVARASYARSW